MITATSKETRSVRVNWAFSVSQSSRLQIETPLFCTLPYFLSLELCNSIQRSRYLNAKTRETSARELEMTLPKPPSLLRVKPLDRQKAIKQAGVTVTKHLFWFRYDVAVSGTQCYT